MTKKTEKKSKLIAEKVQKISDAVTEKIKGYNEKYLAESIKKGRKALKKYNKKYVVKNIEKGKEYFEEPYKKLTEKLDDVLADGKKFIYKLPLVETVEKKVTSGLNSLPGLINMPSKGEINKLSRTIKALNKNIENLDIQKMV